MIVDRGMATKANLETLAADPGIGWITALRSPQVQRLVREGSLQLSLFDEQNLGEISSADYPGERLVVCRNPLVAAERARKREDLLAATEAALAPIKERVEAGTLAGAAEIALAVARNCKRKPTLSLDQVTAASPPTASRPDRRGGHARRLLRPPHQRPRPAARRP